MQLTITGISRKERTSKAGKPYTSVGLKTVEYGERWVSGFGNKQNAGWKAGDKIDVEVEDTGDYLNFTMPEKVESGPAANNAATAEIKNILMLKVIPLLEQLHRDQLSLDERLSVLAQRAGIADDDFPTPDFGDKE